MIVNVNEFVFGLYFVEQSASTILDGRILEQRELVTVVHVVAYTRRSRSVSEGMESKSWLLPVPTTLTFLFEDVC